jgi:hypothetical protein
MLQKYFWESCPITICHYCSCVGDLKMEFSINVFPQDVLNFDGIS